MSYSNFILALQVLIVLQALAAVATWVLDEVYFPKKTGVPAKVLRHGLAITMALGGKYLKVHKAFIRDIVLGSAWILIVSFTWYYTTTAEAPLSMSWGFLACLTTLWTLLKGLAFDSLVYVCTAEMNWLQKALAIGVSVR